MGVTNASPWFRLLESSWLTSTCFLDPSARFPDVYNNSHSEDENEDEDENKGRHESSATHAASRIQSANDHLQSLTKNFELNVESTSLLDLLADTPLRPTGVSKTSVSMRGTEQTMVDTEAEVDEEALWRY